MYATRPVFFQYSTRSTCAPGSTVRPFVKNWRPGWCCIILKGDLVVWFHKPNPNVHLYWDQKPEEWVFMIWLMVSCDIPLVPQTNPNTCSFVTTRLQHMWITFNITETCKHFGIKTVQSWPVRFYHLPSSPEICGSGLQNNMIAPHTGYHVNDTLWYTVIVIVAIVTVAMVTNVQEATCPLVSVFLSAVLSSPTELPVRRGERSCHRCSFLTSTWFPVPNH